MLGAFKLDDFFYHVAQMHLKFVIFVSFNITDRISTKTVCICRAYNHLKVCQVSNFFENF